MTLFPSPMTILRTAGGSYSDATGRWVDGTQTTIVIEGSVQPLTAREILALDAEDRDDGQVWIFTGEELNITTKDADNDGDLLLWNGMRYRVAVKDDFNNGIIPHVRYRAKLVGAAA